MKLTSKQTLKNAMRSSGFTLLETLLAIGILSVVVAQVVSVQSTQISVSQVARNNIRATWALRHMSSQLEYVVETQGVAGLPKQAVELPWTGDPSFTLRLEVKELNLEPSKMIMTAMKIAMAGSTSNDEADEEKDSMDSFKQIASMLDSQLPKDLYRTYTITVSWKEGERTRSIEGGGIVIDNKVIAGLVKATSNAGGGGPGATGSPTPNPQGSPKPTPQGTGGPR